MHALSDVNGASLARKKTREFLAKPLEDLRFVTQKWKTAGCMVFSVAKSRWSLKRCLSRTCRVKSSLRQNTK